MGKHGKTGRRQPMQKKSIGIKPLKFAKQLNHQGGYAGYSDWRLPTVE